MTLQNQQSAPKHEQPPADPGELHSLRLCHELVVEAAETVRRIVEGQGG
jgi:hypothetical protein